MRQARTHCIALHVHTYTTVGFSVNLDSKATIERVLGQCSGLCLIVLVGRIVLLQPPRNATNR
jgi:hypothetical protein